MHRSANVTFIITQTQLQCEEGKEKYLENSIKAGENIFMAFHPPLMLHNWYRWQKDNKCDLRLGG